MFNVKLAPIPCPERAIGFEVENAIKLPKLRSLVAADLVGDVEVVGRRGGWVIRVTTGEASPPLLAAATGAIRVFTTSDSAIQQLIRLGITRFQVIADEYESGTLRAARPDRAAVLKQQAEYDAWLKAKLDVVDAAMAAGAEAMFPSDEGRRRVQERLAHYKAGRHKG
ncbi:hypothetical protein [Luteibacter aegosomatissinici]|uniref:hypothetical protein n=1 Tax=Luteibacter aegosomatissinici TaxID=2911539 RepID=UPI001FF81FA8|nr:hypothetical protein [Luteibacter aegosomatissinici]UPG94821.1 hypothetical protein L2Y97_01580 [Luteibacter aegosomatissinici]